MSGSIPLTERSNGPHGSVVGPGPLAEDAAVPAKGGSFESFVFTYNVPSETEVETVLSQAAAAVAALVKPAQKCSGQLQRPFKDPDRHLWEVAYNP